MTLRKSWLANLLLVIFGLVLALVIWSFVRGYLESPLSTLPPTLTSCETAPIMGQVNDLLRNIRLPCTEARYQWPPDAGYEYDHLIHFNNFGLNGPIYTLEKPPDVFRMVIVGDSFAQGVQVTMQQGFPRLLAEKLTLNLGRQVEVINLSIDAYGTDRELLLYALLGWQFQPDLVLLSLYPSNDIQDNQIDLEARRYSYKLDRPFFTLDDGQLILHNSPTFDPSQFTDAAPYSWLIDMQSRQRDIPPDNRPERPAILNLTPYTLEYPVELGLYLPEDSHWTNAWALTEALLLQFRDVVTSSGVPFAAVMIPDRRVVHAADWETTLNQYAGTRPELRSADPTAPDTRLETFLTANDIPLLNLTPALRAWAGVRRGDRLYYADDGHFNPAGHAVTADEIAAWLHDNQLIP